MSFIYDEAGRQAGIRKASEELEQINAELVKLEDRYEAVKSDYERVSGYVSVSYKHLKGLNDALMDRIAVLERRMETGLEAAARAMAAGGFAAGAGALTGDNGGMTADAAIGGTQAGMGTKPKPARSEDITEVIRNWLSICNGVSMALKPIREHYTTCLLYTSRCV